MHTITPRQQKILEIILQQGALQSSEIQAVMEKMKETISLVTTKRALSEMTASGLLQITGSGRSTKYNLTILGRLYADVNTEAYLTIEPDKRYGMRGYNFDLLTTLPSEIFTMDELNILHHTTTQYRQRSADLPPIIQQKEWERLVIELSWKSSKIEGNTYSLLDTEKLILEHTQAAGHSAQEASMILNHKDAFQYIRDNVTQFKTLTRKNLEELHSIIVRNMPVGTGLRHKPVGVTGSRYRPLDNAHQIAEAVEHLSVAVARMNSPYAKALTALLGISYIQPFEDGNKRTARLMTNALLLAHSLAPLSYRSVDEEEYRAATLVWYELNTVAAMKKIFIEQYIFAAQHYAVTA